MVLYTSKSTREYMILNMPSSLHITNLNQTLLFMSMYQFIILQVSGKDTVGPTKFSLYVDGFRILYYSIDIAEHLINALQEHYIITIY